MSDLDRGYKGVSYSIWREGWTAECGRCNQIVAAERTRKQIERAIRDHINEQHPRLVLGAKLRGGE